MTTPRRLQLSRAAGWRKPEGAVSDTFGLGSTYSIALCRRFDFDPDEEVKR